MSEAFITENFLLESDTAVELYRGHAEALPIIDYHSHVPARDIAEDVRFENLTRVWLDGDHYKWRAMRANGVDERFVTGDASDREKFERWAETVPRTLRNPLYHWTHLELRRYFDVDERLSPKSAERIWREANDRLATAEYSCRGLVKRSNVEVVCTTNDPVDSLAYHSALAEDDSFDVPVLPAWRPDRGMAIEDPDAFNAWVDELAEAADVEVVGFPSFLEAIRRRHDYFHERGCRLSDHGLETAWSIDYSDAEIRSVFEEVRAGDLPDEGEVAKFKSAMLYAFGVMDHEKDWVQQFHLGAIRNVNRRMLARLGPDSGFDSIGDLEVARPLARLLDRLDGTDQLAKTILYNVNPRDNHLLASMIGNFPGRTVPGKLQWGSGWWFLDQKDGIEAHLNTLSNLGLLSTFVGMLTDSRSFLSYPRHDYFRRILCNLLGDEMERGLLPRDLELVGAMVEDICHHNAARYFGFASGCARS